MTHHAESVDVLVIGAGAGGLYTAALLARRGYKTLVVERLEHHGGRASTRQMDGFAVNTGALGIELGTETEQVFREVGAELNVRPPSPGIVVRVGGKDLNISSGINGWVARTGTHMLRWALQCIPPLRPRPDENTQQWVERFTKNPVALGTLRNFVGSIFAVAPQDLSAALFLRYATTKGAFKRFGFPPGGTKTVWDNLIAALQRDSGQVWLNAEVQSITFNDQGLASGAVVQRGGETVQIKARIVVSDVGPAATVKLAGPAALPPAYVQQVQAADRPSAIITVYFASEKSLARFPGFACFSTTRRLCYAASFTPTCPENAPPGWHIYAGASVPHPAIGDFDEAQEIDLLMQDLRDEFPGFEQARVLDVVVTKGEWPAQRAAAGFDLPHATPVQNLWNVGDAVKQWGNAATSACAETALLVADEICARYPVKAQ